MLNATQTFAAIYDIRKGVSSIGIAVPVIGIGVSDPPNVTPDGVVPVSTSPVELDLIGLGVSPVDEAVVG